MKLRYFFFVLLTVLLYACSTQKHATPFRTDYYITGYIQPVLGKDTITYIDSSRMRRIPVAVYYMKREPSLPKKIIILNPGYGGTRDGYRFLVDTLAKSGYMVVVIQHDLPGDAPLSETGDIYKLRKPIWDNGVKDIFFAYNKIQKKYPWQWMDYKHPVLIGHSNGGDMAMLIANEHPDFAKIVITLDNRRVPLPRALSPKILSIRSSDQPADAGVLPTEDEQKRFHIKIIKTDIKHNDMGGTGTKAQSDELTEMVLKYLKHND